MTNVFYRPNSCSKISPQPERRVEPWELTAQLLVRCWNSLYIGASSPDVFILPSMVQYLECFRRSKRGHCYTMFLTSLDNIKSIYLSFPFWLELERCELNRSKCKPNYFRCLDSAALLFAHNCFNPFNGGRLSLFPCTTGYGNNLNCALSHCGYKQEVFIRKGGFI